MMKKKVKISMKQFIRIIQIKTKFIINQRKCQNEERNQQRNNEANQNKNEWKNMILMSILMKMNIIKMKI